MKTIFLFCIIVCFSVFCAHAQYNRPPGGEVDAKTLELEKPTPIPNEPIPDLKGVEATIEESPSSPTSTTRKEENEKSERSKQPATTKAETP